MRLDKRIQRAVLVLAATALIGCDGDFVVGPNADATLLPVQTAEGRRNRDRRVTSNTTSDTTEGATADEASAEGIVLLNRVRRLREDISKTAVIGPAGGRIRIRKAGLSVTIPEGALSEDVEITLTAPAGRKVLMEFQPHGLQFNADVKIKVAVADVEEAADAFAIYYDGDPQVGATVLEFLRISRDGDALVFGTDHFSGYALASGSRSSRRTRGWDQEF